MESLRANTWLNSALSAITAAVVGVILNLAVFFAYHVLWPDGFVSRFEWPSAVIGAAAFVALWRYKAGIIPVIVVAGVAGLAWTFLAQQALT
jgi:chromate transporter